MKRDTQNLHDCYQILELDPGASLADINQAYKDLVFIWHPDRIPADNERLHTKALEKIKAINQARDTLRHHHHRARGSAHAPASASSASSNSQTNGASHASASSTSSAGSAGSAHAQSSSTYRQSQSTHSDRASHRNYRAEAYRSQSYRSDAYPRSYKTQPQTQAPWDTGWEYQSAGSGYRPPPHYWSHTQPGPNSASGRSPNSAAAAQSAPEAESPAAGDVYDTTRSPAPPAADQRDRSEFRGANLQERDLSGRDLSGYDLQGTDLSDAFLHKINLSGANLQGAKLFRANLLQANLRGANLREVNLISADLSGADLTGADLTGAKVGVGNKIMVKLTGTRLDGVIMPDGTTHP